MISYLSYLNMYLSCIRIFFICVRPDWSTTSIFTSDGSLKDAWIFQPGEEMLGTQYIFEFGDRMR